ncbi:MAG: 4-hydroxythreonine-4-phosphate dehydrogenase PdxA [Prevotella sp.]|nr:4-hydroxythreonine-4-phosphate dehydrogenase PdxA [Prevotella sp.]
MEEKKIRVAITHGDTNGIGYETIFKTFSDPTMLELCIPIIYGSPKIAAYHRKSLGIQANFTIIGKAEDAQDNKVNMLTTFDEEVKVDMGTPSKLSAQAASKALLRAINDFGRGLFDVLVTAPVNPNESMGETDAFANQKQFIESKISSAGKALHIYVNEGFRIASATGDMPLGDALQTLTKEMIIDRAKTFIESLRRDFRLSNPRLALLQVNPKAGTEEETILKPAIEELHEASLGVYGPYIADEYFSQGFYRQFDGTLAIHYDQAITPFRLLAQEDSVSLITGLPIIVTAPFSGPCFDIAGKGIADENDLRQAIYLAVDTYRNRVNYDEPLANPLKKLYHEKRDESEKVRFTIPKKHDQVQ